MRNQISYHLLVDGHEYFLSFVDFPWFQAAAVAQIMTVKRDGAVHLNWPMLDVDLTISSIAEPEKFPLTDREMNVC